MYKMFRAVSHTRSLTSPKKIFIPTRYGMGLDGLDWVFFAVTGISATAVRDDAGTCAVSWVLLTTVVARAVAPKYATHPGAKLVPFRVSVKPGSPTALFVGLILVSVGVVAGFTVIVNGRVFETVLSGFRTNTFSVPTRVKNVPGMVAVNCVLETNVVGIAVPFHTITLPLTNPVPFAVSATEATLLKDVFGLSDVNVGGVPAVPPVTMRGSWFVLLLLVS